MPRNVIVELCDGTVRSSTSPNIFHLLFFAAMLLLPKTHAAGQGLVVTYGTKGVSTLAYNGLTLENVASNGDAFHMNALQCTDLQGNIITDSRCSWGETNLGESWNGNTQTETYTFSWGTITTQFSQSGNNLNITATETNSAGSGLILNGAEIVPLTLHFPQDPANFSGYTQDAITTTGPAVVPADYGSGIVTSVIPNESTPLYGGWTGLGNFAYGVIMASTAPYNLPPFYPSVHSPVQPGQSFSFTVSLRFTPEGTAANAQDGYSSFAATYPSQMTWTDKRIIGTAYLASSPSGNANQPGGFPTNPRRYFNDPSVDITTPAGLLIFQDRMLTQAAANVTNAQMMNAQGVITWDIEGEQYPQATSYVCSPDQIATVAPEMESIVSDPNSAYHGKKLDDSYFATMSSAGLRVGVCLRPQQFVLAPDGTASQVTLTTNAAIIANLENKARYANSRWGVTLFYCDSTVDQYGGTLDPAIFQQLITDFPSYLFIPEEHTPRYYAYTAPFYTFIFHTDLGTPLSAYNAYPHAFGANLINDADPGLLATYTPQLTQSVVRGDILMGHADWWQPNDPTIVAIYAAAGQGGGGGPTTPTITWPAPAPITYGTALSPTQLDATTNVAGNFVYLPPAGTVLSAGNQTLGVTFTPSDTTDYKVAMSSTNLSVTQAVPVISWPAPAPITYGTALSPTQLDATTNVPGNFVYTPPAGTVPGVGTTTLQTTFTPNDTTDYTTQNASVSLTVNSSTPPSTGVAIVSPAAGATVSGVITVMGQITVNLDPAGSYLIVDGVEVGNGRVSQAPYIYPLDTTTLSNGVHALQIWAHDTGNNTHLSPPVSITVANGTQTGSNVVITWPTPGSIVYGTTLSSAQLDATANVPGTFSFVPPVGTLLNAGTTMLSVTFTPNDTTKYKVTSASVNLVVSQATPVITWPAPAPITQGTPLSSAQLNATANVAGTFSYSPRSGTVLNAGTTTLQTTFSPADATDYTSQTASVALTVNGAAPPSSGIAIISPVGGAPVSGVITVVGQITLNLDPAGSYLMVDGVEIGTRRVSQGPYLYPLDTTTLSNGPHVLQLWAHDIGNNVNLSAPVTVTVGN
jgi:hypothetical protein